MKYYNSIENLPVIIFDKICRSADFTLLLIDKTCKIGLNELESAWAVIYNEYIKLFGISEKYKDYLRYMTEALSLYNVAIQTGRRDKITMAQVREAQAMKIFEGSQSGSIYKTAMYISKAVGFRVNVNEMTVAEFYTYIKGVE
jgi:hypothetical protein